MHENSLPENRLLREVWNVLSVCRCLFTIQNSILLLDKLLSEKFILNCKLRHVLVKKVKMASFV